jgi:adenosine deaminase
LELEILEKSVSKSTDLVLLKKSIMKSFPKAELHRHLEGTFPVRKLFKLAQSNKLDTPKDFETFKKQVQFPKNSTPDFLTFLAKFKNDWYRSYDDVYFITYHSVKSFKTDGLFYIELRFSPEHFAEVNNFSREDITKLIIEAGNKAAEETGIFIKYLLTFNRNKQSQEDMIELYDRLKKLDLDEIVGIDLAGDEIHYPPELFKDFFSKIRSDSQYGSTIHAGEVTDPEQIWVAIKELNADRIGHGTVSIRDEGLQDYLKKEQIVLEQCITSNYQTGAWEDEKNHPLGELYKRGVPVTINSDDPFIQDTDLTDDYIKAIRYFDLSLEDLIKLNLTALKATFLPETERSKLIKTYLQRVEEFKSKLR